MDEIQMMQAIRDILDMNDANSCPMSNLLNVEMQFIEDKPIILLECRGNKKFELTIIESI